MAFKKSSILLLICLISSSFASFWQACPNGPAPISVASPSCSGDRCLAVRGENNILTTVSQFSEAHSLLRPRAFVILLGIMIQIPDDPNYADICPLLFHNGVFHGCPTVPGRQLTWTLDMQIPTTIPAFQNGRIRVELLDGTRVVQCFEVHGTMI